MECSEVWIYGGCHDQGPYLYGIAFTGIHNLFLDFLRGITFLSWFSLLPLGLKEALGVVV